MNKFFLASALASAAILTAVPAFSADLDVMPPPPPPPVEELRPATYDWTGITAGVFVAANAVEGEFDTIPICGACGLTDLSMSGIGFAGGLKVGADYQMGDIVFGVMGDWAMGGEIGTNKTSTFEAYLKNRQMGTVRGRLGWALDDTLIYGTAGLAMAQMEFGGSTAAGSDKQAKWTKGFVIGAGMEHALSDNFSVGVEYLYTKFGATDHFLTDGTVANTGTAHMEYDDFHTVRASANYRFSL